MSSTRSPRRSTSTPRSQGRLRRVRAARRSRPSNTTTRSRAEDRRRAHSRLHAGLLLAWLSPIARRRSGPTRPTITAATSRQSDQDRSLLRPRRVARGAGRQEGRDRRLRQVRVAREGAPTSSASSIWPRPSWSSSTLARAAPAAVPVAGAADAERARRPRRRPAPRRRRAPTRRRCAPGRAAAQGRQARRGGGRLSRRRHRRRSRQRRPLQRARQRLLRAQEVRRGGAARSATRPRAIPTTRSAGTTSRTRCARATRRPRRCSPTAQYMRLKPDDPDPYYGLGQTLKALGDVHGRDRRLPKYVGHGEAPRGAALGRQGARRAGESWRRCSSSRGVRRQLGKDRGEGRQRCAGARRSSCSASSSAIWAADAGSTA